MRNSVIGIFLSLCMLAPILGMYGWMQQRRRTVRREVKHQIIAGLERSELVLLTFTPEQKVKLKWKHGKEFEFEGEMYDIVETELVDGVTHYWCWSDDEETVLNKQLFELTNIALGLDPVQQQQQSKFKHYSTTLFHEQFLPWRLEVNLALFQSEKHFTGVSPWNNSPPVPPPEA